jgi:hypothetical protein
MKKLHIIIKNNISSIIVIIGLLVFLYFIYQVISPIISLNLESQIYKENFDLLGDYFN